MKLPEEVYKQFQTFGREGGHQRARALKPEERKRIAAEAAAARWRRHRFGSVSFEALGLPGGDLLDQGLRDYASGRGSVAAHLVAIALPRLQREGVPVVQAAPGWESAVPDPHWGLYRLLEKEYGDLAHSRYHAYLEQVSSFADALAQTK